jgi:hypothetical protein
VKDGMSALTAERCEELAASQWLQWSPRDLEEIQRALRNLAAGIRECERFTGWPTNPEEAIDWMRTILTQYTGASQP